MTKDAYSAIEDEDEGPIRYRRRRRGPLSFLRRGLRAPLRRSVRFLGSANVLILGFLAMIGIGTVLLRLPESSAGDAPLTWGEAFFTSTSAVTVTGLTVVNTANDLSLFGQGAVLMLLQTGGVGFIAISVLLFRLIGRRVTLEERFLVQQAIGARETFGVLRLTAYVLLITVGLELVGALALFLRWRATLPPIRAAWMALFHAVSAYCNAGFDLYAGSGAPPLFGYAADPYSLAVLGVLITLGGFGVPVLYDCWSRRKGGFLSLHSRITLAMTLVLTLAGVGVLILGDDMALAAGGAPGWLQARAMETFVVVSARTAGLTILPLEALQEGSQLVLMIWMFIGGAPASMAGGVSTSAVAVIAITVWATARGDHQVAVSGRSLPTETIRKAIAVIAISLAAVAFATVALVIHHTGPVFPVGFEVVSAYSNTGYSLGVTDDLDGFGRFVIAFLMFWGRLGPLTIVVALAERDHANLVRYPEEPVILG